MILLGSIWTCPGKWKEKTEKRNSQIYSLIMKFNPLSMQCHFILNFIMFGVSQIITFLVWKTSLIKSEFMFVWQLDTKEKCKKFFLFLKFIFWLLWVFIAACGLQQLWRTGLVALRYVESSLARDRTCVLYIGRWILNRGTTREVQEIFSRLEII